MLGGGDLISVSSISLDDFVSSGGPIPSLVKVDVEGGESEVLRGAERVFTMHKPLLVAEVHHKNAEHEIRGWLEKNGYLRAGSLRLNSTLAAYLPGPRERREGKTGLRGSRLCGSELKSAKGTMR